MIHSPLQKPSPSVPTPFSAAALPLGSLLGLGLGPGIPGADACPRAANREAQDCDLLTLTPPAAG